MEKVNMSPVIMAKIIVTNGPVSFMALGYLKKILINRFLKECTLQRTWDRTRPLEQRTLAGTPPAAGTAVSRSPPRTSQVWPKKNIEELHFYYCFLLTPLDSAEFVEILGECRRGSLSRIEQTKFSVVRISIKFHCKIGFCNCSMHKPDFSKNFSLLRSWFLHRVETAWKQECSEVSQFQNNIWRKFFFTYLVQYQFT